MVMDGVFEKKIINLWIEGKYSTAKKELFKYRLKNYDKLEVIEDKIFIDYRLAYLEYLDKNKEMSNMYFKSLDDIYSDEYIKGSCKYEYYKYRWLYLNSNKNTLSKEDFIMGMKEIYLYYETEGDYKMAKLAYGNIFTFEGDGEEVLNTLEYVMENGEYLRENFLNSILSDCEQISRSLYIKALDIINKYKVNVDVV